MTEPIQRRTTHLPLADSWEMWRWLRVRGAGFSASRVAQLTAVEAVAACEELLRLEHNYSELQDVVCELLHEASREASGPVGKRYEKALKKVRKGATPEGEFADRFRLEELAQRHDALKAARVHFEACYTREGVREAHTLAEIARDPRFQEAVLWQNPAGFRTGVMRVAEGRGSGSKHRQHEQLVARYAQRYSAKNDMIGFFGPQGCGEASERGETALTHGPDFLRQRRVYFEHWAIATLADSFAASPRLRQHVRPRLPATMRLSDGELIANGSRAIALPEEFLEVLSHCDGATSVRYVRKRAVASGIEDEDAVDEMLGMLEEKGILTHTFALPTTRLDVENVLREELVAQAGSDADEALADLDSLCQCKERVAAAAGNPVALDEAMRALNTRFEELTGAASSRSAGQAYAGRTLVFEECVRDSDLRVGPELIGRLAPPLALVLASARWFTFTIAERFSEDLSRAFLEVSRDGGDVAYLDFWRVAKASFGSEEGPAPIVAEVQSELRQRWSEILGIASGERRIQRSASELKERVEDLFAAPHPGWPAARYHSPDVMLVADGEQALAQNAVRFVLGEVHASVNTCGVRDYLEQIDAPKALIAAREEDLPQPALVPVIAREAASRVDHVWMVPTDIELELGSTPSSARSVLRVCDLVVRKEHETLWVVSRDGAYRFALMQALENHLTAEVLSEFTYLPSLGHRPRICIDDVIIGRESWRFAPEDLVFRSLPRGSELFVETRRWARSVGLPERVFVKVPEENKPVFIDLGSIVSVEAFAKLARKASAIAISEMLPDIDELWLSDHKGDLYTSELRIVAVDPTPWPVPDGVSPRFR